MNIKDCHFTSKNIMLAVLSDGTVLLANKENRKMYRVSVVKRFEPVIFGGTKTVKIKNIFNKE